MNIPITTIPRLSATPTFDPLLKPAIHLPKHKLLESPNSRTILVGEFDHAAPFKARVGSWTMLGNWRITSSTNPISNAPQCDQLQSELGTGNDGGIPLPEMTFGSNSLKIEWRSGGFIIPDKRQKRKLKHNPNEADTQQPDYASESEAEEEKEDTKPQWTYEFDTLHALLNVKKGELEPGDGGVKVGYAEEWLKSRTGPSPLLPMPKTVPTKPYDWTYTTTYCGHSPSHPSSTTITSPPNQWTTADSGDTKHQIPLAELTRPDPILFYAEIPLFEDELHDNGSSALLVRIRVMPTCIFILSRFTLRVDGVLFRTYDTRLYSSLEDNPEGTVIVRETTGWEAPYDTVKNRLPKRDDLTPLTDPLFIAKILSELPQSQTTGAGTGWRGLGKKCEWMRIGG